MFLVQLFEKKWQKSLDVCEKSIIFAVRNGACGV